MTHITSLLCCRIFRTVQTHIAGPVRKEAALGDFTLTDGVRGPCMATEPGELHTRKDAWFKHERCGVSCRDMGGAQPAQLQVRLRHASCCCRVASALVCPMHCIGWPVLIQLSCHLPDPLRIYFPSQRHRHLHMHRPKRRGPQQQDPVKAASVPRLAAISRVCRPLPAAPGVIHPATPGAH